MRLTVPQKTMLGLMICLASAACSSLVGAEEFRFTSWTEDGIRYRFDNQSSEICKLMRQPSGLAAWVRCDVAEPKQQQVVRQAPQLPSLPQMPSTTVQYPNPAVMHTPYTATASITPTPTARQMPGALIEPDTLSSMSEQPAPLQPAIPGATRQIQVFDDNGVNITNRIDDSDRAACRPIINGYDALHVSHTLKTTGDRISGIVILDNKGNRKIAMLELTMTVRVVGKDKPIEHKRFIFSDKNDDKPPAPAFGSSGLSVLKKVDVPTPAGVISGMPDVRVTFIKFDDKE